MSERSAPTSVKQQKWRDSIATTKILKKIQKHVWATVETDKMSATQLKGAEMLLKRTMPTLSQVDVAAQVEVDSVINVNILAQEDIVED